LPLIITTITTLPHKVNKLPFARQILRFRIANMIGMIALWFSRQCRFKSRSSGLWRYVVFRRTLLLPSSESSAWSKYKFYKWQSVRPSVEPLVEFGFSHDQVASLTRERDRQLTVVLPSLTVIV